MEIIKNSKVGSNASHLVENLSDLLKHALENTNNHVSIREEIRICKSYVEIQKFRYEKKFYVIWEYEDDILDIPVLQ